ncbi:MAG: hypothetical protein F4213_10815 [Boseongicola sp. SB0677_bin_26]|nr:hypothetical protein [Boseongicola sp. SB0665_bin_10]MYG26498.1 hypothetical protein [Boseongicola sp. SB0677_bin_26]
MVSAISLMVSSSIRFDYGSNELVYVVLELFPNADCEMAFAVSIGAVALCQKVSLANRVGNPKRIVLISMTETALNASLGVAERFTGRKNAQCDGIGRNQPQGTGICPLALTGILSLHP